MVIDILQDGFEATTIDLAPDDEGAVVATLVRKRCPQASKRAVLYIHGFVDYFFQTEMAEQYLGHGFNFYALDLRKYGRSLRPHQTPNYVADLTTYFEEISAAIEIVRNQDGNEHLLLNGHSTGCLIASLYAHHTRTQNSVDALFLNSPFFDFNEPWISRKILIPFVSAIAPLRPKTIIPQKLSYLYVESIHKNYNGEWNFDLAWKPRHGFPIYAGWLRAIHRAHRELQAGLDIACPILMMSSTCSSHPTQWDDILRRSDSVLNVDDMGREAEKLGDHVTMIRIADGLHDLMLSARPVRTHVYKELFQWLDTYFPNAR